MMDPPWQLATANPTRGVALGYSQLTDADITALPIPALQANGFLFIWVINAKYKFALDLFASWGYECVFFFFFFCALGEERERGGMGRRKRARARACTPGRGTHMPPLLSPPFSLPPSLSLFPSFKKKKRLVDEIVWVKTTVNRRLAKSHGYYLQHAKEACLVGRKGQAPPGARACVGADVICAERRGQSQKPEEIYQLVEALVPNGEGERGERERERRGVPPLLSPSLHLISPFLPLGTYLEIFGRKNNLRDFWVTVGNEVTGKGPPREDVEALAGGAARVPGAVYGAAR